MFPVASIVSAPAVASVAPLVRNTLSSAGREASNPLALSPTPGSQPAAGVSRSRLSAPYPKVEDFLSPGSFLKCYRAPTWGHVIRRINEHDGQV